MPTPRPKTDRRSKQADESRTAILEATLEIASERGYEGTTVSLVSRHSGLPASSIYWHFGNKEQLLAAALVYSYEKWKAEAGRRPRATSAATTRTQIAARFQRHLSRVRPEFWTIGLLLVMENRVEDRHAQTVFADIRRSIGEDLREWWSDVLGARAEEDAELIDSVVRFQFVILDGLYVHALTAGQRSVRELVDSVAGGVADYLAGLGIAS